MTEESFEWNFLHVLKTSDDELQTTQVSRLQKFLGLQDSSVHRLIYFFGTYTNIS